MIIVLYRKFFFVLSTVVILLSIGALILWGIKPGIEFTGGTIAEVSFVENVPDKEMIESSLVPANLGAYSLRATEKGYILRTQFLSDTERGTLLALLETVGAKVERLDEVGPTFGNELKRKAFISLILVILAIALYVAFAFRGVSKPSSFVFGAITILILAHDVLVPAGFFALLGQFFGAEADTLFLTALLVILGYSVNDTIVIFDRVRENARINAQSNKKENFEKIVGKSLSETYARSINTSLTVLLSLGALYWFGAPVTENFALMLIVGVLAGTYSSICLAAPLLVWWEGRRIG